MHEVLVALLVNPTIGEKDEGLYSLRLFMPYDHIVLNQLKDVYIRR